MEQERDRPGCMDGGCAYDIASAARDAELLLRIAPDVVAVVGFDGTLRRVNPAAERATGRSQSELIGSPFQRLLHADDIRRAEHGIAVLARGRSRPMRLRLVGRSGEASEYEWNTTRIDPFSFLTIGRKIASPPPRPTPAATPSSDPRAPERLVESVPDGLFELGADGRVVFANRRCTELLGLDGAIGARWQQLVEAADQPRVIRAWQSAIRTQQPFAQEIRCRTASGKPAWVWCKAIFEGGSCFGVLSEIVPARWVNWQLFGADPRARMAAEAAFNIVMLISGPLPLIKDINPPGASLLGNDDACGLIGRPVTDLLHPDDHDTLSDRVAAALRTWAASPVCECNLVRADGTLFPAEGAAIPVIFEGEPSVYLVFRDISERRSAERALRQREHHLAALAKAAPVGIFQTDVQGLCTYVNGRYLAITGYDFEEVQGAGWREHVVPEDRREVGNHWRRMVERREACQLEHRLRRKDGRVIWVLCQAVPEVDEGGEIIGYIGSLTDVNQSKLDEIELRNYREHLEEMVRERTVELEAVNSELEAFSYSVSHDLRGPLRAIIGFNNALLEEQGAHLNEEALFYLRRIQVNTRQMSGLIDDLLELSKVTKAQLQRKWVDLNAMAAAMLMEMQLVEPLREVEVSITPDLKAFADPHLVGVLMQNLLANAWKYTGRNARARIEFGALDTGSGRAFFVRDNGVGFDMACVPYLFQAFHRLHDASQFEGTGIGLATVHRIVMRHGGKVWAEGEEGKGATFFFVLH